MTNRIASGRLKININVEAVDNKAEYEKNISIPIQSLSEVCMRELSPAISEVINDLVGGVDRGLKRISGIMICPKCREKLEMYNEKDGKDIWFECKNGHR